MSIIELSLYGEIYNQQPFGIIPPAVSLKDKMIYKKKCCNNCDYFEDDQSQRNIGWCLENVANDLYGEYIKDSDTFYCSYHKFKV